MPSIQKFLSVFKEYDSTYVLTCGSKRCVLMLWISFSYFLFLFMCGGSGECVYSVLYVCVVHTHRCMGVYVSL